MKKNIFFVITLLVALLITGPSLVQNCFAAYAYSWTVDGEQLRIGNSNTAGTASWQRDNEANKDGGTLTLNNYNGGQIKIECWGTGLGHTFNINLVGDNYITVDKGIGILALEPITFSGDGTLTIEAAVPISSNDYIIKDGVGATIEGNYSFSKNEKIIIKANDTIKTNNNSDNSATDVNANTEKNDSLDEEVGTIDNDLKTNDTTKDEDTVDWKLIAIIMIAVASISITVVIICLLVLFSKKNKTQTADNDANTSNINTNLS
ncbi:hypothetical protein IKG33_01265 [Candidatus Saccharibacteria bacterium]|nr:hypothetical protein [Candidatus Saccharibacteria bacterium]